MDSLLDLISFGVAVFITALSFLGALIQFFMFQNVFTGLVYLVISVGTFFIAKSEFVQFKSERDGKFIK